MAITKGPDERNKTALQIKREKLEAKNADLKTELSDTEAIAKLEKEHEELTKQIAEKRRRDEGD